jgi:hypothetical protein
MDPFLVTGLPRNRRGGGAREKEEVTLRVRPTAVGWEQRSDTPGWNRDYVRREKRLDLESWFECDFASYVIDAS